MFATGLTKVRIITLVAKQILNPRTIKARGEQVQNDNLHLRGEFLFAPLVLIRLLGAKELSQFLFGLF